MRWNTFLLVMAACLIWMVYQSDGSAKTWTDARGNVWQCGTTGCQIIEHAPVATTQSEVIESPVVEEQTPCPICGKIHAVQSSVSSPEVCPRCGKVHAQMMTSAPVQYTYSAPVVRYGSAYSSNAEPVVRGPLGFPRPFLTWRARRFGF